MDSIAKRIKELIDSLGLTNSEFAKQTNLNPATVSHILGGRNKASLQVIENIKGAFTNVNIDYLIGGEGSLYKVVTNVNTSPSGLGQSDLFPMEGLRMASVGNMPSQAKNEIPEPPVSPEEKSVEDKQPPISEPVSPVERPVVPSDSVRNGSEKRSIESIVIFYSDGSFKSYTP